MRQNVSSVAGARVPLRLITFSLGARGDSAFLDPSPGDEPEPPSPGPGSRRHSVVSVLEPGAVIAGKYRLERPLARGGMGAVWVARHVQLDMPVAIKFMDPAARARARRASRFEREAKAAAAAPERRTSSRSTTTASTATRPYIVMELLEGEDLGARLQPRAAPLPRRTRRASSPRSRKGAPRARTRRASSTAISSRATSSSRASTTTRSSRSSTSASPRCHGARRGDDATRTGERPRLAALHEPGAGARRQVVDHRSDLWSLARHRLPRPHRAAALPGRRRRRSSSSRSAPSRIPAPRAVAPDLPPEVDAFFARALAAIRRRALPDRARAGRRVRRRGRAQPVLGQSFVPTPRHPARSGEQPQRGLRAAIGRVNHRLRGGAHGLRNRRRDAASRDAGARQHPLDLDGGRVETVTPHGAGLPASRDMRPAFVFGGVTAVVVVLGPLVGRVRSSPEVTVAAAPPPSAQAIAPAALHRGASASFGHAERGHQRVGDPSAAASVSAAPPKKAAPPAAPPRSNPKRPSLGY